MDGETRAANRGLSSAGQALAAAAWCSTGADQRVVIYVSEGGAGYKLGANLNREIER